MVHQALDYLRSWLHVRTKPASSVLPISLDNNLIHWKKHPSGYYKCNIDASLAKNLSAMGFGIIVHDDTR